MFGLGWSETLVITLVALLVLKPDDLLMVGRKIRRLKRDAQRMLATFQKATKDTESIKKSVKNDSSPAKSIKTKPTKEPSKKNLFNS